MDRSKIIEFGTTVAKRKRQQPQQEATELVWTEYIEDGTRGMEARGSAGHNANSTASGIYHEGKILHAAVDKAVPRIRQRIESGKPVTPEYFRDHHPVIYARTGDYDLNRLATPFDEWDTYRPAPGRRHRQTRGMVTEFVVDVLFHALPLERDYIANCVYGGKIKK